MSCTACATHLPTLCLPALPVALSPVSLRGHPHPGDRQGLCGHHQGLQNVSCRVEASHSPLLVCCQQRGGSRKGKGHRSLLSAQSQMGSACFGHQEFRSFQQCQVVIGKQVRNEAFGREGQLGHPEEMLVCINNDRAARRKSPCAGWAPGSAHLPLPGMLCGCLQMQFHTAWVLCPHPAPLPLLPTCGQRPDPNLLLAPTSCPWCQLPAGCTELLQEALAALALFLQLGGL